ncbi:unnamed protein product [Auanema sp. JU1783]|nr:unnamed protein product [Auanema sp. JU1783]
MTRSDRRLVQDGFNELKRCATPNGLALFVKLFSEHPEYKDIWPQFRAIPDSSLLSSDVLRNHATVYMRGLQEIVNSIDDDSTLRQSTRKIALSHLKWNIHKKHIQHMVPELLAVLSHIREGNVTEEEKEAWRKLYDIIGNLIDIHKKR